MADVILGGLRHHIFFSRILPVNTAEHAFIYHDEVVLKPGPIPEFYRRASSYVTPKIVDLGRYYAYRFITGREANVSDLEHIIEVCQKYLWRRLGGIVLDEVKTAYFDHVNQLAKAYAPAEYHSLVLDALETIALRDLPLVNAAHGDLNFDNIIVDDHGRLWFIDPASNRGMDCEAIERGKLLQSYSMRWGERAWDEPRPLPAWAGPLEWAFLVTHWVRLIRFWPELDTASGFAALERLKP